MGLALKQSTASQEIILGYFLDSTDGNTEETGLTIANTDIKIWKNGATTLANKNSGGGTHISNGVYYAVLDATDTDTVGPMVIFVHVAGALSVRLECHVYEEAIYDALFGASAAGFDANQRVDVGSWLGTAVTTSATSTKPEVDVNSISDDATAANNLELDYDGTGYAKANSTIGTTTTNTDMVAAAPTAAANADAVWDELATGHTDAGKAGEQMWTDVDAILADTNELQTDDYPTSIASIQTDTTAIVADTNELQGDWTNGGRLDLIIDAILADTAELQTDDVPGLIAALNNISAANVNTEVVDVLRTDTATELAAVPAASPALHTMVQFIYMKIRNKETSTASAATINDDAGSAVGTSTLSDDGSTFTKGEYA